MHFNEFNRTLFNLLIILASNQMVKKKLNAANICDIFFDWKNTLNSKGII